jgi:hypothetical protein
MPCNHICYFPRLFCRRSCICSHQTNLPSLLPAQTRKRYAHAIVRYLGLGLAALTNLAPIGIHSPGNLVKPFLEFAPRLPRIEVRDVNWFLLVLDRQRHAVHS